MTTMTRAQFARQLGKSRAYVRELVKMGRVQLDANGHVLVEASQALIDATKDPSKQGVSDRHERERQAKHHGTASETPGANDAELEITQKTGSAYQFARATNEKYKALKAKQEYELSTGKLLVAADVEAVIADGDMQVRTRLESLPDMLAPQLAAESDEQRIRALLADQIEHILTNLCADFTT